RFATSSRQRSRDAAMSEPEELLADAARHATVFARDLWRRRRPRPREDRRRTLTDITPRLDLLITAVFGAGFKLRIAQPPPPTTLLKQVFGGDRGPRTTQPVPATDGKSLWLPAELDLDDDALVERVYRTMALAHAMRARRGAVRRDREPSALVAGVYLLLEAYAADEALVATLPGIAPSIDLLRTIALEQPPPVGAFPAPSRPLERLVRELLRSRAGAPAVPDLVTRSPEESHRLARRIARELEAAAGTRRLGSDPLLKDWWTGALRPPAASDGASRLLADTSGDADDAARAPRSARLRRRPERRAALDGEDDEHESTLVAVQQDDPHPHAEDPMGLKRPVDRDDANPDELGDMVSDLPEARTVATPTPPKEVLLSDDPPEPHARLVRNDGGDACLRYPEWDYRRAAYRLPGAGVRPSLAADGSE